MTTVINARSATYARWDNSAIRCEVLFSDATSDSGDPVWLPYTATATDPADYGKQLFADLQAGKYGAVAGFTVTPEMLEYARLVAARRINSWRDEQENGRIIFSLFGRNWDCDKTSRERLEPVIAAAGHGVLPEGFFWTDADNNDVPLTTAELLALGVAMQQQMVTHGFKIHERQRQMKQELAQLTDIGDLNSYQPDWPQTEPPGSNSTQAGTP